MSWPIVNISEVTKVVGGATPKSNINKYWGGDILWATPKDLSDLGEKYISDTPRKITESGLRSCATEILPPNSVLFSSRAPIGHVAINTEPMATNQGFKSFVPSPKLDPSFLYWWLDANREYLQSMGTGATFKEVSKTTVQRIEIPLPPLEEQKRIAAILDQADGLRRLRQTAITKLNALGQSIFYRMFGDPIGNSMGWPDDIRLGDKGVSEIVSGITKGRKLSGSLTREVPYLAVVNVQDRYLSLKPLKKIDATDQEIKKYLLQKNDLLLTEGGDPDKLGRGTLWNDELPECIHQNHVFRVRLLGDLIRPVFLNWIIGSNRGKTYFLRSAKQTTGIASINKTQLKGFPLLVPPLELQRAFEDRIKFLQNKACLFKKSFNDCDRLFGSLQHRAFRGEL